MSQATPSRAILLAGHVFAFEPIGHSAIQFSPVFRLFETSPSNHPFARYRVHEPDSAPWPEIVERQEFWRTDTWRLGREADGGYALAIHVLPDEQPLTVARFTADFTSGDLLQRAGRHGAPTPFAFNYPCDQVAVLNAINPRGIGVIHAGAVAFDNNGVIFCGRSGAGKTTLSRLCRDAGATLLNDDRQFVWADPCGAWLAPTPWHGLEPEINNRTVPLRAIFHLAQAPHNRLIALKGAESAARLIGNTVAPFYLGDAMQRTLAWADKITSAIPSYRLEFTPTADAVALCASCASAAT